MFSLFANAIVMKKSLFCTCLAVLTFYSLQAQYSEITVQGKVVDLKTGKGVKANIHYKSMPTGSIFGDFNDSTFAFSIFGTARYEITAEAAGYNPRAIMIDPKAIDLDKKIFRMISLTPVNGTITLHHLIFQQGKAVIDPKSYDELNEVARMMKENPRLEIQLEGHTDNVGSIKANLELSESRVDAVKKYLVEQGIAKGRIQTKAFGGSQPLSTDMSPEARVLNRRVELRILKD